MSWLLDRARLIESTPGSRRIFPARCVGLNDDDLFFDKLPMAIANIVPDGCKARVLAYNLLK
jgi:hypothetical protein